ncbi:response regulator [Teredinibacter sp. KSP-S5-2]|uniref:response regulator n=1 Tax=Teredinibacter sp. KSP-S5-2 TaxID=3034506 RepID=UPI002935136A|nr:response regulator [Teredinibacter sp. KSP-S5-2]WNO07520.1 response regulator [Teredinibacter sp. KSP-S5-2]
MLTQMEQKIVLATLTQRRAWLRKAVEDSKLDPKLREENIEAIKLLDSALQKISKIPLAQAPPIKDTTSKEQKMEGVAAAKVLVAEDNGDSASLLMEVLSDMGFKNVDLARDGKEAFDKIKLMQSGYDLILCDWDMPELSGLEVHQKGKASNTLKNAHFMMVTAVSEGNRIREAIQQGIDDYIVKPIDVEVLESKIKSALKLE